MNLEEMRQRREEFLTRIHSYGFHYTYREMFGNKLLGRIERGDNPEQAFEDLFRAAELVDFIRTHAPQKLEKNPRIVRQLIDLSCMSIEDITGDFEDFETIIHYGQLNEKLYSVDIVFDDYGLTNRKEPIRPTQAWNDLEVDLGNVVNLVHVKDRIDKAWYRRRHASEGPAADGYVNYTGVRAIITHKF